MSGSLSSRSHSTLDAVYDDPHHPIGKHSSEGKVRQAKALAEKHRLLLAAGKQAKKTAKKLYKSCRSNITNFNHLMNEMIKADDDQGFCADNNINFDEYQQVIVEHIRRVYEKNGILHLAPERIKHRPTVKREAFVRIYKALHTQKGRGRRSSQGMIDIVENDVITDDSLIAVANEYAKKLSGKRTRNALILARAEAAKTEAPRRRAKQRKLAKQAAQDAARTTSATTLSDRPRRARNTAARDAIFEKRKDTLSTETVARIEGSQRQQALQNAEQALQAARGVLSPTAQAQHDEPALDVGATEVVSAAAAETKQQGPAPKKTIEVTSTVTVAEFITLYRDKFSEETFHNNASFMRQLTDAGLLHSMQQVLDHVKKHPRSRSAGVLKDLVTRKIGKAPSERDHSDSLTLSCNVDIEAFANKYNGRTFSALLKLDETRSMEPVLRHAKNHSDSTTAKVLTDFLVADKYQNAEKEEKSDNNDTPHQAGKLRFVVENEVTLALFIKAYKEDYSEKWSGCSSYFFGHRYCPMKQFLDRNTINSLIDVEIYAESNPETRTARVFNELKKNEIRVTLDEFITEFNSLRGRIHGKSQIADKIKGYQVLVTNHKDRSANHPYHIRKIKVARDALIKAIEGNANNNSNSNSAKALRNLRGSIITVPHANNGTETDLSHCVL